ncbi:MAG TPA: MFS transporter, partial [Halomonas sp.]|nr:MFS transporter [Halomonas sp.]
MAAPEISQSRLYEWLTGDDDSRMCKDIPDEACDEQPRNFFLHLIASLGNKLADELSSARLVLPWLLGVIGAPLWMIGLLVPIRESGALLPQLFVAGFIRLKPQRKWVWVAGGLLQAAAAACLALLALFGTGGVGGSLVLATLVALSLARGLSSIATKDVLGKTIAKQRRGNLMGWSGSVAGAVTLAAGGVLMLFEDRPGEIALAVLLGVAALGWALNALCAARIHEAPGAVGGGENAWDSIKLGLRLL